MEKIELQLAKKLTEKCSVIGLKEAELKLANEKISIFEDKCLKMEKDLSTLKGKEKVNETSVSFISNVQLEKELNMRIDELLQDNSKMKATLKGFTDSSVYMGRMLDGIGNHSQRQGIGFNSNTSKQKRKPTQVFEKRIHNVPSYSVVHDDTYFFDEPYTKKRCHFCNCVGHLSFDCFARYFPKKFAWRVKKTVLTNTVGINTRLPTFASPSAGASPSSK